MSIPKETEAGKRPLDSADKQRNNNNNEDCEDPEYDKFSKSEGLRSSSTPKILERESSGKDLRNDFVSGRILDDEDDMLNVVYRRSKNYSTVSLPNYDELEVVKKEVEREDEDTQAELATPKKPGRLRITSTSSLPMPEEFASLPPVRYSDFKLGVMKMNEFLLSTGDEETSGKIHDQMQKLRKSSARRDSR